MRVLKLALISFIFLFLLVTFFSLFIPGEVKISKATNIAAGDSVFNKYVEQLPNWKSWHPAFKDLPEEEFQILKDQSISVKGTTISVIERKDEEIVTEISKPGSKPILSGIKVIRHQQGDSATIQWYMNFKLKWYPWEKFKSLFYENFYGMQMEQGLANLKLLDQ